MHGNVLVVDDQPLPRRALANELRDGGFTVQEAADGAEGWSHFCQHKPDLVITDLVMPASDGLQLLGRIRSQSDVPVILFSAYGTVQSTAAAFKAGAQDFLCAEELSEEGIVERVSQVLSSIQNHRESSPIYRHFVGQSPSIKRLRSQLGALAPLASPVLIFGQGGTGRDSAVRALHELGFTTGGLFTRIEPATPIPDLSSASPAALYLDGFERFPSETRNRWLQRLGDAERRGYGKTRRIFISSTWSPQRWRGEPAFASSPGHSLLNSAVGLPHMATYRKDIPEIAAVLCARISSRLGRKFRLSTAALRLVAEHEWRGQARQLSQLIERAIHFSSGQQVRRETLELMIHESADSLSRYRTLHHENQQDLLTQTLRQCGGNISLTARRLNRSRGAVYRMLSKYRIPTERGN